MFISFESHIQKAQFSKEAGPKITLENGGSTSNHFYGTDFLFRIKTLKAISDMSFRTFCQIKNTR